MHLFGPCRIDEQRAADCDEIEFFSFKPVEKIVDAGRLRAFAAKGANELT